jgi:hypothetical protein
MAVDKKPASDLARAAREEARVPLLKDFFVFLLREKRWWLTPIIIVLVLLSLLTLVSSSAIAPFIYSLF